MFRCELKDELSQVLEEANRGLGLALYPLLESRLTELGAPPWDWVPVLDLGSALYLCHGRLAEGERLARRAVARALPGAPDSADYLLALAGLARAFLAQGREAECKTLLEQIPASASPAILARISTMPSLPQRPPEEHELETILAWLARSNPFPLWHGDWRQEIPAWLEPYPLSLDQLAGWALAWRDSRLQGRVAPLLSRVKNWRRSSLSARWLGSVGNARFTYHLDLELVTPERTPRWLSVEVGGSGYECLELDSSGLPNLKILPSPEPPTEGVRLWRVLFRGGSQAVASGLRCVVRVGFEEGPPLQALIFAE